MKINILYLCCFRNINFTTSVESMNMQNVQNVKDSHCRQTVDWDNISLYSENEEVDKPNEITNNATTTTVECSSEIKCSNKQILTYSNCMFNTY